MMHDWEVARLGGSTSVGQLPPGLCSKVQYVTRKAYIFPRTSRFGFPRIAARQCADYPHLGRTRASTAESTSCPTGRGESVASYEHAIAQEDVNQCLAACRSRRNLAAHLANKIFSAQEVEFKMTTCK